MEGTSVKDVVAGSIGIQIMEVDVAILESKRTVEAPLSRHWMQTIEV